MFTREYHDIQIKGSQHYFSLSVVSLTNKHVFNPNKSLIFLYLNRYQNVRHLNSPVCSMEKSRSNRVEVDAALLKTVMGLICHLNEV